MCVQCYVVFMSSFSLSYVALCSLDLEKLGLGLDKRERLPPMKLISLKGHPITKSYYSLHGTARLVHLI